MVDLCRGTEPLPLGVVLGHKLGRKSSARRVCHSKCNFADLGHYLEMAVPRVVLPLLSFVQLQILTEVRRLRMERYQGLALFQRLLLWSLRN